jgi:1D-myo-inositol-tetrakisphosphate 5-kinase/inositol-polyphosphate multikinase
MSDASGGLVIKPCVAAEVDFYETTNAEHPDFAQLMPAFMGSLQRGPSKDLQHHLSASASHASGAEAIVLPPSLDKEPQDKDTQSDETKDPLHGKKLDTELAIVLENVLAGFTKPNFVDVKLGSRLWADDAPLAKRAKLDKVASETTSGSLGFRVAGMKIWHPEGLGEYKVYDKFYGRHLTPEKVKDAFTTLLCLDQKTESRSVVEDVIANIEDAVSTVEQIVANQESRMYSASLLFVYEGDPKARKVAIEAALEQTRRNRDGHDSSNKTQGGRSEEDGEDEGDDGQEDEQIEPKLFDLKMIDFAHAAWTPGQGPDENMLTGIRSLQKVLKELMKEVITSM